MDKHTGGGRKTEAPVTQGEQKKRKLAEALRRNLQRRKQAGMRARKQA